MNRFNITTPALISISQQKDSTFTCIIFHSHERARCVPEKQGMAVDGILLFITIAYIAEGRYHICPAK